MSMSGRSSYERVRDDPLMNPSLPLPEAFVQWSRSSQRARILTDEQHALVLYVLDNEEKKHENYGKWKRRGFLVRSGPGGVKLLYRRVKTDYAARGASRKSQASDDEDDVDDPDDNKDVSKSDSKDGNGAAASGASSSSALPGSKPPTSSVYETLRVPKESEVLQVIASYHIRHGEHCGTRQTHKLICKEWTGIARIVVDAYVARCEFCATRALKTHKPSFTATLQAAAANAGPSSAPLIPSLPLNNSPGPATAPPVSVNNIGADVKAAAAAAAATAAAVADGMPPLQPNTNCFDPTCTITAPHPIHPPFGNSSLVKSQIPVLQAGSRRHMLAMATAAGALNGGAPSLVPNFGAAGSLLPFLPTSIANTPLSTAATAAVNSSHNPLLIPHLDASFFVNQLAAHAGASHAAAVPAAYRPEILANYGRALIATKNIKAGTVILRDQPISLMTFSATKRRVRCCDQCGRFVGDLAGQVRPLVSGESLSETALKSLEKPFPVLSPEANHLTTLIYCMRGCGEVYCSIMHRDEGWVRGHAMLCTKVPRIPAQVAAAAAVAQGNSEKGMDLTVGENEMLQLNKRMKLEGGLTHRSSHSVFQRDGSDIHPYEKFLAHAQAHHEFFEHAARIAAGIVTVTEAGMGLEVALAPYQGLVQKPWWDIVNPHRDDKHEKKNDDDAAASSDAMPSHGKRKRDSEKHDDSEGEDDDSEDEDDYEGVDAHLRSVVSRSHQLLAHTLFLYRGKPTPSWFSLEWYAGIVGALRLNAIGVEHVHPLRDYFELVNHRVEKLNDEMEAQRKIIRAIKQAKKKMQHQDEDEEMKGSDNDDSDESSDDSDEDSDSEDEDEIDEHGNPKDSSSSSGLTVSFPSSKAARFALRGAKANFHNATNELRGIFRVLMPLVDGMLDSDYVERESIRDALARIRARTASSDSDPDAHQRVRAREPDSSPLIQFHWNWQYRPHCSKELKFTSQLFPSFHGSALYGSVAQINHSCEPNAVVEHDQDAEAVLTAIRDIHENEQIFISYINEDQDYEGRKEDLAEYGFNCQCSRCLKQE